MIAYYGVKNFKSLLHVGIKTTNLNVFMGLNSMGKSSIIQSMLVLRQSWIQSNGGFTHTSKMAKDECLMLPHIFFKGALVSLECAKDVFCQNAQDKKMDFYLYDSEKDINLKLSYDYEDPAALLLNGGCVLKTGKLFLPSLFTRHVRYLSANHIGPQAIYDRQNADISRFNELGNSGELAPFYLADHGNDAIENKRFLHPKSKSENLSHVLDAWLSEISPGTRLLAEKIPGLDLIKMAFQFENKNDYSDPYLPVNVGFGLSYVMPLILNVLISKPGDILIVENPESHLHPRGQAKMGRLLALAAQSDVQIFCETHSDHVLNGMRVAVKDGELEKDKICIFYSEKDDESNTRITTIPVDAKGELECYPDGVLDEWGNLMARLI